MAISASENQLGGVPNREYSAFEALLKQAGLRGVKELLPQLIWDLGYWDHMTFIEEEEIPQLMRLSRTLFPNSAPAPVEGPLNSKWRNQQCDILVAWTHARYKRDYLVTSDGNFHRRATELRTVGVHEVIHPEVAAKIARHL